MFSRGQPRYIDTWIKERDLNELKSKILYGITENHLWRKFALEDIKNIFKDDFCISSDDVILDFGCGIGRLIKVIAEKFDFKRIIGLDVNKYMMQIAQESIRDLRVSFMTYDGGVTLPFDSNFFDKIYSVLTIQHVDKHYAYFIYQDMLRILKPGGKCVLQIENYGRGARNIIESWINAAESVVIGAEDHYIELYTEEELRHIFSDWLRVDELKIDEWQYEGHQPAYYRVFFKKPLNWTNRKFSWFRAYLDSPTDHSIIDRSCEVCGWAVSTAGIEEIIVEVDGKLVASLSCDFDRSDVARAFPTVESSLRSGFKCILDVGSLSSGKHNLRVTVRDQQANSKIFARTILKG